VTFLENFVTFCAFFQKSTWQPCNKPKIFSNDFVFKLSIIYFLIKILISTKNVTPKNFKTTLTFQEFIEELGEFSASQNFNYYIFKTYNSNKRRLNLVHEVLLPGIFLSNKTNFSRFKIKIILLKQKIS
jgi:hypothetical protein